MKLLRDIFKTKTTKSLLGLSLLLFAILIGSIFFLNQYAKNKTYQAKIVIEEPLQTNLYRAKLIYPNQTLFKPRVNLSTFYDEHYVWNNQDKPKILKHKNDTNQIELYSEKEFSGEIGTFYYKIHFPSTQIAFEFSKKIGSFLLLYFVSCFSLKVMQSYFKFNEEQKFYTSQDKTMCIFIAILCLALFLFTFWLGFPGYHLIGDTYNSIFTIKDNAHPVFIAYFLQLLYFIFGKNLYYLFLINLIPFYLGLWFLICGFYLRFKTKWALLLMFPTFIGNIYFQNFIQYTNFGLSMLVFLAYCIIFFIILVPMQTKKQKILLALLFVVCIFALLWRHNAIFSIYPICIIITYKFIPKDRLFKKRFLSAITVQALLSLAIVILVPKFLTISKSYPANHAFLHQIAGCCVPNNDSSCFNQNWYYPHKTWEDVKTLYNKYPLNADPFNVPWGYHEERPFKHQELPNLHTQWIKAIIKYPKNFIEHELRFFKTMWFQEPGWIFSSSTMQTKNNHHIYHDFSTFPQSQLQITFSPIKEKIYNFLYQHKITLNHFWGVCMSLIVMCLSTFLFIFGQRNTILVYAFSVSFAGFWSAFFIAAFTTVPETRYMSPILPMGILSVIGITTFFVDRFKNKQSGGV